MTSAGKPFMDIKPTILLILAPGKNRARLLAWLGQDFQVTLAETVGLESPAFDLAILDRPAWDRCRDLLGLRKEAAAPVLLPLLLLASPREVGLLPRHLHGTVDEVILTPLKQPELLARVANLLRLRRLSLELHRCRAPRLIQTPPRDLLQRLESAAAGARMEAAQLHQVQKLEALGTFAGGIAHEFNNVLGAVKGYIELAIITLEREGTAEKVRSKLEAALQAGDRALELVKQILAFSRHHEREPQPVEILPIVKEALKLLRASLPGPIKIRQRLEPQCGQVLADPVQISQILMNLCSNASHAMQDRGGVLEVNLDPVRREAGAADTDLDLPEGDYIRLTVSDNGHGIDPRILGRIFDPFFTTKVVGEGTGLGLSALHGIVKNLAGAVKVTSKWGRGSTFQVYLPRYRRAPRDAPAAGPAPQGAEHILLVDDEPDIVQICREYLERLGYRVTAQGSSPEAWEAFRKRPHSFDLVITDLTMPGMTGVDLAAALLRLRPELPIILTTGYDGAKIAEQAHELGLRDCLMKPLVLGQLARVVRRALDNGLGPAPPAGNGPAHRMDAAALRQGKGQAHGRHLPD